MTNGRIKSWSGFFHSREASLLKLDLPYASLDGDGLNRLFYAFSVSVHCIHFILFTHIFAN